MAGSTYAVLVAVEKYQQESIQSVQFAVADAKAMKDVLVHQMNVPPQNISLWVDKDATRSRLEEELPYAIRDLGSDDQFIFFYAGHGFHSEGVNRLTTWDTHPLNIPGTTVGIDKVLLTPLKNAHCNKSLAFIDACATTFGAADILGRNLLVGMRRDEFADFVKSTNYRAAFFSCSPTEQSFSSSKVNHGIWTYHLLRAFGGHDDQAFARDRCITGSSLRDYLAVNVPKFLANETEITAKQRPYAELASNGDFEILIAAETAAIQEHSQAGAKSTISVPQISRPDTDAQMRYWSQRKNLANTKVFEKVLRLPRWCLWSRPTEFRKARFRDLDHCRAFVSSNCVHSQARWSMYPYFTSIVHDFESVAGEMDHAWENMEHYERWVLFQSGQFVHNMALDRVATLGDSTDLLEILSVTSALFEFIARMADQNVFTNQVGISVELRGVAGRQLAWRGKTYSNKWCQEESIVLDSTYTAEDLRTGRRELALDAALAIYAQFGLEDPPRDELAIEQQQTFG